MRQRRGTVGETSGKHAELRILIDVFFGENVHGTELRKSSNEH